MISVTVPYTSSRDSISMTDALAHLGAISMRYPISIPGELVVTLHRRALAPPISIDQETFRTLVIAAIANAPAPIRRESTEKVFKRAVAKSARGKPLSNAEKESLDRAETE